jgi:glutamine synthetase
MAAGMSALSDEIEKGTAARDAVAAMYKTNRSVIFTGNGYSAEWPAEAAKRGLPNLNTTPKAVKEWASSKNIEVFKKLNILTEEETKAKQETMYEMYNTTLMVEVKTMIQMVESGFLPACAKDLNAFANTKLAGGRQALYESIMKQNDALKAMLSKVPSDMVAEAEWLCNTVKPQMDALRKLVDEAEGLMEKSVYPYPSYEAMLYHHHH